VQVLLKKKSAIILLTIVLIIICYLRNLRYTFRRECKGFYLLLCLKELRTLKLFLLYICVCVIISVDYNIQVVYMS